MASNIPNCDSCRILEISKPSAVWCCECEEGLCSDCEKRHKGIRATKSHQLIPIDKYRNLPTEVLKASQTCPEHNERYATYCDIHECSCCVKCMLESHKDCKTLKPIDDIVRDIKTSNVLRECEESLAEIHENISAIIKDQQQNSSSLKNDRKRIESEIRETKLKAIKYLNTIETKLLQQLSQTEESENVKIQTLIKSLQNEEKEIDEIKENFMAFKEHATDFQVFIAMKNIEKRSSSKRKLIYKLSSSNELNNSVLSVELDKALKNIEENTPSFGRVSLKTSPRSVVIKRKKDSEAQSHVSNIRSIDSIGLDFVRSIDMKKNKLYGCCFLPDGRYAFACENSKCIIVMTEDGSIDCQIDVYPYFIKDITHIPSNNTLAATTGLHSERCIIIINLNTRWIARCFPSNTSNYGIAYKDGHIYYCVQNVGLCKMNLKNKNVTMVKKIINMSVYSYIAIHEDNLYYTNRDANTVTCCSMDGATKWEFWDENVLIYPEGICVDNQRNIYVIGYSTNNLVLLSPDGSYHSELLSNKDGLLSPIALDIDKSTNRLLFTNEKQKAFVYRLK